LSWAGSELYHGHIVDDNELICFAFVCKATDIKIITSENKNLPSLIRDWMWIKSDYVYDYIPS